MLTLEEHIKKLYKRTSFNANIETEGKANKILKSKEKQPYLASVTRNSNSTEKPKVDGALILLPPLY